MPVRGGAHRNWPAPFRVYVRGLATSITSNVPAYGYTILITSAVLAIAADHHAPHVVDAFLYLLGATLGFGLVGALAALAFEEEQMEEHSPLTVVLGSAMSIVSVGSGFGLAVAVASALGGWIVWLLTPFAATVTYVLVLAAELAVAAALREDH